MTTQRLVPGHYYVLDSMRRQVDSITSGPFEMAWDAERDRREWNCADDLIVSRWTGSRFEQVLAQSRPAHGRNAMIERTRTEGSK